MNKILILVDMQKDFLEPDGKLWIGHDTTKFVDDVEDLVKNWDGEIYGLLDIHDTDSCEFEQFPPHCLVDTEGAKPVRNLYDKFKSYPKIGFVHNTLMQRLANKQDDEDCEYHFAGVLAHLCVLENIAALYHFSKYYHNKIPKIKVNSRYVDDVTPELKTQAFERMKKVYNVEILKEHKPTEYEIVYTEVKGFPTGVDIAWGWKQGGWGHLSFGIREGKWFADTECMSEEFIAEVLKNAAPQLAEFFLQKEQESRQ